MSYYYLFWLCGQTLHILNFSVEPWKVNIKLWLLLGFFASLLSINFSSVNVCLCNSHTLLGVKEVSSFTEASADEQEYCAIQPGQTSWTAVYLPGTVLSTLWICFLQRICGWVRSPCRKMSRRHVVYRGLQQRNLKTSSSCGLDNFYGKWTFCCLVSRRRWYLIEGI